MPNELTPQTPVLSRIYDEYVAPSRWAFGLLMFVLLGNLLGVFLVGVHHDEAYYWQWSVRLDWGYFDHAPLIGWMMRPFTAMFGVHAWVIRIPSMLTWFVTVGVVWRMADQLFRLPGAGVFAALVMGSLPIMQAGFHLVTPDAPMLLFAAVAYYFVWRAVVIDSARDWVLAGIATGATLLGKYPGVLLPLAVFLALIFSAAGRRTLTTRWPWLAVAIAGLMFLPVILWNASNDWISFAFQLGHGVDSQAGASWFNLLAYLVQQMVMTLPWVWVAMIVAAIKARGVMDDRFAYVLLISGFAVPLVFFGLAGLTSIGGANWPVMAYIPASILLGGMLARWGQRGLALRVKVATIVITVLLSAGLTNLLRYTLEARQLGIPVPDSQINNTYNWPVLGRAVKNVLSEQRQGHPGCVVMANWHLLAASLAFELKDVDAVIPDPNSIIHQYVIWQRRGLLDREPCVYVRWESDPDSRLDDSITVPGYGEWVLQQRVERVTPKQVETYGIYTHESVVTH